MFTINGKKPLLTWRPPLPKPITKVYLPHSRSILAPALAPIDTAIPIWNQGNLGSCTAHGNGRIWSHRMWKEKGVFTMPSRLFIYYGERVLEGDVSQDAGAVVEDGLKTMAKWGVPHEPMWPYVESMFAHVPPTSAYQAAVKDVALDYANVNLSNINNVKIALSEGNPVVFGFTVYESFMSDAVASTGIMPMPASGEQVEGGHCVVFVGYDDTTSHFWCTNSWDTNWGIGGRFKMPYEFVSKYCSDAWILTKVK